MATSWRCFLPWPVADVRTWITRQPIVLEDVLGQVGSPGDGASVLFLGHVRDHNDGRPVTSLSYDAYAEMAEPILARIVAEAAEFARHHLPECGIVIDHQERGRLHSPGLCSGAG